MMRMSFLSLVITLCLMGNAIAQNNRANWLNEATWPAFVQHRPISTTDKDSKLVGVSKQRYNAALDEFRSRYVFWLQGTGTLRELCENAERLAESSMGVESPKSDPVALLQEKLAFAIVLEQQTDTGAESERRAYNVIDQNLLVTTASLLNSN